MKTEPLLSQAGDGLCITPEGKAIRPRNLRTLLTHARSNAVTFLCVTPKDGNEATLEVHFDSGYKFLHRFASYRVCLDFANNHYVVWNRCGDLDI
jgi:hypothetical protein